VSDDPTSTPPPFDRLGDYEVLAPISEGGMASVWLGRSSTGELVALKVIREEHGRNKDFVAMLVDEAGIASRMAHPNVLSIRALGHDGRRHFLVMDLLRGHSLLEVTKAAHARGKRLPVEVVAWLGARVADALHYAHELRDDSGAPFGVVHRDVNPANIFVTADGVPKLIDFGLAKARDRIASTAIGVVKGKLAYLAPEQAQGQAADRRSDVFALGVTLWEVTLDRRLFLDGSDVETVRRVREADVPDPRTIEPGYPDGLADVILKALARRPTQRWQTAGELRDALDAYLASTGAKVDASSVRAAMHDLFGDEPLVPWQRVASEAGAEQERTRIWEERKNAPAEPHLPPPPVTLPVASMRASARAAAASTPPVRLVALALACALGGSLVVGLVARGCRARQPNLEERVARIEDMLGLADAGAAPPPSVATASADGAVLAVSADEHSAPCAIAKIAGYQAWQDALSKAKLNARPAEAACADIWNEKRKQGCFYAAMAETRTTQAARDAIIAGGAAARDAVKAVKDDPKNDAIAAARTASEVAFSTCGDDAPAQQP
jgi:serine/threonine-protein kinase